jgi:hypothetical protein
MSIIIKLQSSFNKNFKKWIINRREELTGAGFMYLLFRIVYIVLPVTEAQKILQIRTLGGFAPAPIHRGVVRF